MLEINKFNKIIAANWKLNGSLDFIQGYFKNLHSNISFNPNICGIICLPAIYLHNSAKYLPPFFLGAQDCSNYNKGSYTGEISATMLKDIGCQFCIIGHSERRQLFNHSNNDVCKKVENLINNNIIPIICVGETLEQKNAGLTKEVLNKQISNSIPKNTPVNSIIIAYEPIWAIGTGLTPNLNEIEDIHLFIKHGIQSFENYKILYGGSVKSSNAADIMKLMSVDGVLIGGASLDPKELKKIMLFDY